MWDIYKHDYIALVEKHGNALKASRAIGLPKSTFYDRLQKQKKAQEFNHLGLKCVDEYENQNIKGMSTLYDEEGNVKLRWLKTDVAKEEQENKFEAILNGLIDDIPKVKPRDHTKITFENLCSLYVMSDFHLGQYSSIAELGEQWDNDTAYDIITNWIDNACHAASYSNQAVLCDLGDFLHADSLLPVTPSSGHILDADGRFRDVQEIAIKIFDYAIQKLLDKHKNVHVIIAEGNHDISSSYWLTLAVSRRYEDEPRVTFDFSKVPYYAFEWGNTSLYFHHGHKKRINDVSKTLVAQFREMYGRTKYAYAHVGHLHHRELKECSLMVVEQHSTLAAKDAHSARGGYHSERGAVVINYHKEYGETGRSCIRPQMLL